MYHPVILLFGLIIIGLLIYIILGKIKVDCLTKSDYTYSKDDSDTPSRPNNLECAIEIPEWFCLLKGIIQYTLVYPGQTVSTTSGCEIISSIICQFTGVPVRSIIFTGYDKDKDKYINLLMTNTQPPYTPVVYCAVYVTDSPFTILQGVSGRIYTSPLMNDKNQNPLGFKNIIMSTDKDMYTYTNKDPNTTTNTISLSLYLPPPKNT